MIARLSSTGLPRFLCSLQFLSLFKFVSLHMDTRHLSFFTLLNQFLMILIKLCIKDIAYRYCVNQSTVSKNFRKWISACYALK